MSLYAEPVSSEAGFDMSSRFLKGADFLKSEEIHVGDVLRVRQFDDILREIELARLTLDVVLMVRHDWFPSKIKDLCGKLFTVKAIHPIGFFTEHRDFQSESCNRFRRELYILPLFAYQSEEEIEGNLYITAAMLEPIFQKTNNL